MKAAACIAALAFAVLPACKTVQNFIHDDEVVARVGEHKLFLSEVVAVIPGGIPPSDSAHLAQQYITSWAKDQLFLDVAEEQLSREEKDVSRELEEFRTSLLKYRYEQRYVNERLDTTITDEQVDEYYQAHKQDFVLSSPIVKGRFLRMLKSAPGYERLRRMMSSDKVEDILALDSLAFKAANRYSDFSDRWVDAVTLEREFGAPWRTVIATLRDGYVQMEDPSGQVAVAYLTDMVKASEAAPQDYCRDQICDILLSQRKRALTDRLESEIVEDAKNKNHFVIY